MYSGIVVVVFVECLALAAAGLVTQPQQSHSGSYTTVYSAYSEPNLPNVVTAMERQGTQYGGYPQQYAPPSSQYAQPQSYPQPQQQQYGFKDPGFSMQTGFEGFLVPNPLYSVLPWGVETVLIAIVGIVIFVAVKIGIIFFLMKILKIGKIFKSDEEGDLRAYIPSFFNKENISDLASTVFDAIDRYNEVSQKDEDKTN